MINIKSNKAITMITLIITVVLMLILSGVTINSINLSNQQNKHRFLESDLKLLKDELLNYYNKYGDIPFKSRSITLEGRLYKEIDLAKLGNLSLNYGKDYGKNDALQDNVSDVYVSDLNLNIYFLKGVRYDGQTYH